MTHLQAAYEALKQAEWIDLSHQITPESPHFPALPALEKKTLFTLDDGFFVQQFSVVGQYGTHIDAPRHFVAGGRWLEQFSLKDFFLPLVVVDLSDAVADNPDLIVTKEHILAFEATHGPIAPNTFVAFRSDWFKRWPNQDALRNLDENGVQRTPGWGRGALQYLIEERHVAAIGHETLDTDAGVPAAEHGLIEEYYVLSQDIFQIELLNHLDRLPATGAYISIAFPHWQEATGSPARVVAYVPKHSQN